MTGRFDWDLYLVHEIDDVDGSVGGLLRQQLVGDHTNGPDVTLTCVGLAKENLWSHVQWGTSHTLKYVPFKGVDLLSESKVSDLVQRILHEDVGGSQVSMDDLGLLQLGEATR